MNATCAGKRCTDGQTQKTPVEHIKPLFDDMFVHAVYERINPFSCIPFANIRSISQSGLTRLISLLDTDQQHCDDCPQTGIAIGSDTPIVVPLNGSLRHLVYRYFREQGLSEDRVNEEVSKHTRWFGIIDGNHRNQAVRWLVLNKAPWSGFNWMVTILKSGFTMERYRQLARFQNHRQSPRYYIQVTIFDELSNLRSEYNRLCSEQTKPSHALVARTYFGTQSTTRTMTMMASLAVRLDQRVLDTLGSIINQDHPDQCLSKEIKTTCNYRNVQDVMKTVDCRIHKDFVKLQSLYASKVFMNARSQKEIDAQCNSLHRLKSLHSSNGFKTIQPFETSKQYIIALDALQEESKFLAYLQNHTWPHGMTQTRINMLQDTAMDHEITSNKGNELSILDSLRIVLRRLDPDLQEKCDAILKEKMEVTETSDDNTDDSSGDDEPPDLDSTDDENEPENVPTPEEIYQRQLDEILVKLNSKGINCINSTWKEYKVSTVSKDDAKVDLLITEPPTFPSRSNIHHHRSNTDVTSEPDKEEVLEFAEFAKCVIKPGGYAIITIPFYSYNEWYDSFHRAGFDIMPHPYVIMYDSNSIQNRNTTRFPQNICLFGLVCFLPGPSTATHKCNFNSPFQTVNCSNKRNTAGMFNVIFSKSKLCKPNSKIPFYNHEQSVDMLSELIDLFCSHEGLVMDPYAGTLTAAIASLRIGRKCISIEKNKDCFNRALERLSNYLPSSIALQNITVPSFESRSIPPVQHTCVRESDNCVEVPQMRPRSGNIHSETRSNASLPSSDHEESSSDSDDDDEHLGELDSITTPAKDIESSKRSDLTSSQTAIRCSPLKDADLLLTLKDCIGTDVALGNSKRSSTKNKSNPKFLAQNGNCNNPSDDHEPKKDNLNSKLCREKLILKRKRSSDPITSSNETRNVISSDSENEICVPDIERGPGKKNRVSLMRKLRNSIQTALN